MGNGVVGLAFDRATIQMNKFLVTCLEAQFHVFDARTRHPQKGGETSEPKNMKLPNAQASIRTSWQASARIWRPCCCDGARAARPTFAADARDRVVCGCDFRVSQEGVAGATRPGGSGYAKRPWKMSQVHVKALAEAAVDDELHCSAAPQGSQADDATGEGIGRPD